MSMIFTNLTIKISAKVARSIEAELEEKAQRRKEIRERFKAGDLKTA